jgi:predicted phage-related endonuclease
VSKVVDDAPEAEMNEDMVWGAKMEGLILDETEERLNLGIIGHRGTMWRNTERPWMVATPDGVIETRDADFIVEAKKTNDWKWDEFPPHYHLQVQWQLATLGLQQGYLAALHRGRRLELYLVTADPELQAELIEAGEHFWETYVVPEVPPPATAEDNTFLASLYPTSREEPVEVDAEIIQELRQAKHSMTKAKARLAAAEAALKEILGDADTAVADGKVAATWKTQTSRRLDTKALKAQDPVIAEKYTVERSSRVLRVRSNDEA